MFDLNACNHGASLTEQCGDFRAFFIFKYARMHTDYVS